MPNMSKIKKSLDVKHMRLFAVLCLVLIVSLPVVLPRHIVVAAQTGSYYNKVFSWDYDGRHWTWNRIRAT